MEWDTKDILEDILNVCDSYSAAKDMVMEELDHVNGDELGEVIAVLQTRYGVTKSPSTPAPAPVTKKEPPKVAIRPDRELTEEDWAMIKVVDPALAMQMLRLRFRFSNMPALSTWLKENCSGFYHLPGGNRILFELEDDAVLFKMTYEGKS